MYKVIQLTNTTIGAVDAGALLPLGAITRRYGSGCQNGCNVFEVATTGANTIILNEEGYYNLTYNASLTSGAVGDIILDLLVNNVEVLSVAETVAAVGNTQNISLSYVIRVLPNCGAVINNSPATVQIRLDETSVALTGGTSNIIIEKRR